MEKKDKIIITAVLLILPLLVFVIVPFIRGGWKYILVIVGLLIILFSLVNFTENFSPKSKIGKFGIKILTLIKDFIDEMMRYI